MTRALPAWMTEYRRTWLRGDLLAGLTVWALIVPESMAYAGVAGVPPQYGLYAVILAVVGYALFGSSRQLFVGPSSTVAALSAVVIAPLAAGDGNFIALTAALAILVGALYVICGLLRLGFIANFFAKPVLDGFIAGLGLYIIVGQIPKLVGIEGPDGNTVSQAVKDLAAIGDWELLTVAVGALALAVLFGLERLSNRIPGALVVSAAGIVAVPVFGLGGHGLATVGQVSTGFESISWSSVGLEQLIDMAPGAGAIVVVGFAQSVAIAKAYGAKHGYRVDPNREMIGYGAANVGAGVLGGFTVTGSLSKSAAAEAAGGRTPVVSLVAGLATLATVLWLATVFENLPEAVLAAIVIHAVSGMVDFEPLRRLWRARSIDLALAVAALAGVILIGILPGIVIGVVLSLILFQHHVNRPHTAVLGRRPDGESYGDADRNPDYETDPRVMVYRWDAPLIFANADRFIDDLTARIEEAGPESGAIVLDFQSVHDVDTTGSAVLLQAQTALENHGLRLYLARVHCPIRRLLRRDGTADQLRDKRFHDTVRSAVEQALSEQGDGEPPPERQPDA